MFRTNRVIAEKVGVTEPNVSRWKRSQQVPRAEYVAEFARAYNRPVLEAFVAAGFLTAEEAHAEVTITTNADPDDDELLEIIARRLARDRRSHTSTTGRSAEPTPLRRRRDDLDARVDDLLAGPHAAREGTPDQAEDDEGDGGEGDGDQQT